MGEGGSQVVLAMGQTSSQVAPTQQPPLANTQSVRMTPLEANHERPTKKRKLDDEGRPHKLAKARPQHRRGVAIQPRKDANVGPPPDPPNANHQHVAKHPNAAEGDPEVPMAARFERIPAPPLSPESSRLVEQDTFLGAQGATTNQRADEEMVKPTRPAKDVASTTQPAHAVNNETVQSTHTDDEEFHSALDGPFQDEERLKKEKRERKKARRRDSRIAKQSAVSEPPNTLPDAGSGKERKRRKRERRENRIAEPSAVPEPPNPVPDAEASKERKKRKRERRKERKRQKRLAQQQEALKQPVVAPEAMVAERIPTPPRLDQLEGLGIINLPRCPKTRINTWLDGHETGPGPNSPDLTSHVRLPRRSSQSQADSSDEYQDDGQDGDPDDEFEEQARPVGDFRTGRPMVDYDLMGTRPSDVRDHDNGNEQRGKKQGQWSQTEKQLADSVWNAYVKQHRLDDYALRLATINWVNVGWIKNEMYDAFPERTIETIRKFVQRHFTPYKQGPWTEDEEELLIEEHERTPGEWTLISGALMRPPQAVRDRWRNVTQDRASRMTGPWSMAEEADLLKIIGTLVTTLRENAYRSEKVAEYEPFIDWKRVNQTIGGKRSAKRCIEKWHTLKERYYGGVFDELEVDDFKPPTLPLSPPSTGTSDDEDEVKPISRNRSQVEAQYAMLEDGDIWDALFDIELAMEGRLDETFHDESTFWSIVATYNKGQSKYSRYPGLRRRCYYGALKKWRGNETVKRAVGMARKAVAMQALVLEWDEEEHLKRAFRFGQTPGGGVEVGGEDPAKGSTQRSPQKTKKSRQSIKSEAIVIEDDDSEDDIKMEDVAPPPTFPSVAAVVPTERESQSNISYPAKKRKRVDDSIEVEPGAERITKRKRRTIIALNGSPCLSGDEGGRSGHDLPPLKMRWARR